MERHTAGWSASPIAVKTARHRVFRVSAYRIQLTTRPFARSVPGGGGIHLEYTQNRTGFLAHHQKYFLNNVA